MPRPSITMRRALYITLGFWMIALLLRRRATPAPDLLPRLRNAGF